MVDIQTYIKNKGVSCPFCETESIQGGFLEIEAGRASQEMSCIESGRDWQDVYQLVDIIPDCRRKYGIHSISNQNS